MSYTSKFTGEEIDTLLSSINTSINYTNQLLPNFFSTPLSSIQLNDSIHNYDFIHVTVAVNGTAGKTFKKTVMIYTKNIKGEDEDEFSIYADTEPGTSTAYSYALRFGFSQDGNYLLTSYIKKSTSWSNTEIGIDSIVGIKMQNNMINTCDSNPIGSILPVMGIEAPQDYLICDGRELNINEYKELANYFEKQFGSKNHFGGDGNTTFSIPDLRNEFLRGYGDKSNEIGIHQDGTKHPYLATDSNTHQIYHRDSGYPTEMDEEFDATTTAYTLNSSTIPWNTNSQKTFTSRPTNVAVLFCIKYTENDAIDTNTAFSQTNILFPNEQERIISKQGRLVTFSLNSNKGFTDILADRWVKIGEVPEEYKPAEPASFTLATYSPNTTGYGKVDSADGSIYVYFNSTLNNNTQLFANVTYSV